MSDTRQFDAIQNELRVISAALLRLVELGDTAEKQRNAQLSDPTAGQRQALFGQSQQAEPTQTSSAMNDDAAQTFDTEPVTGDRVDEVLIPDSKESKPASATGKIVNAATGKPKGS